MDLMESKGEDRVFSHVDDMWPQKMRVSVKENDGMSITFNQDKVVVNRKP
jgi:hypothetical protein